MRRIEEREGKISMNLEGGVEWYRKKIVDMVEHIENLDYLEFICNTMIAFNKKWAFNAPLFHTNRLCCHIWCVGVRYLVLLISVDDLVMCCPIKYRVSMLKIQLFLMQEYLAIPSSMMGLL